MAAASSQRTAPVRSSSNLRRRVGDVVRNLSAGGFTVHADAQERHARSALTSMSTTPSVRMPATFRPSQ